MKCLVETPRICFLEEWLFNTNLEEYVAILFADFRQLPLSQGNY